MRFDTCALHAKEQKHSDDCQECSNSVGYDIFKWVIIGNEQNVENRGGWQISRQQATCIRQNGTSFNNRQTKESDRPYSMECLKIKNKVLKIFSRTTKPGPLFMIKRYCSMIKICATIPVVRLRDGTYFYRNQKA